MMSYRYRVAGHVFCIESAVELRALLSPYEPFVVETTADEPVFVLRVVPSLDVSGFVQELHQDDDGSEIVAGRVGERPCFEFRLFRKQAAVMLTSADYRQAEVMLTGDEAFGINNALMVLYALSTANLQTLLFHSSVVSYEGQAYMFLGKSGTGKSTHSGLWLKHIEGTELVNDDNPVVRVVDGVARVYGSPWSGKTPCYRNVDYPIGAIVQLSQAPRNDIRQLRGVQAYAALVSSISGKRWDARIADGLHDAENWLAQHVAMFHLECLPDAAAAKLCCQTTAGHKKILPNETAIAAVAELIKEGRHVVLPVKGYSMLPFIIGGKERVELVARPRYVVGDVVLAWVNGDHHVVHRVIAADGDRLTLLGDGNIAGLEHCLQADVIARAEVVVSPDDRRRSLYTPGRMRFWRLWNAMRPIRRWILAVYRRTWLRYELK